MNLCLRQHGTYGFHGGCCCYWPMRPPCRNSCGHWRRPRRCVQHGSSDVVWPGSGRRFSNSAGRRTPRSAKSAASGRHGCVPRVGRSASIPPTWRPRTVGCCCRASGRLRSPAIGRRGRPHVLDTKVTDFLQLVPDRDRFQDLAMPFTTPRPGNCYYRWAHPISETHDRQQRVDTREYPLR